MEQDVTAEHQVITFMDTNMPITTTPTNINAIILNSQIPGVQRQQASVADTITMSVAETAISTPATTLQFAPAGGHTISGQTIAGQNIVGHTIAGQTVAGQNIVGHTLAGQTVVGHTVAGQTVAGQNIVGHTVVGQTVAGQNILGRTVVGHTVTGQTAAGQIIAGHTVAGQTVVGRNFAGQTPTGQTNAGQTPVGQTIVGHALAGQTVTGHTIAGHTVTSVGVTQAQLPIFATAGSLKLPPIVGVDGAIKPDISLCSRVLNSFSDQDQASSDLEVQSVMFPETRGLLPTVKRICPSRSSSSSKSSKSSYSPMRQPTTLTNAKRGNIQTVTPTFLTEDMTIHQLAAQGELTLLSERIETYMEKVDTTDIQGYTPLMWACSHDQIDVIEYLLRQGANASKVSVEGECALAFACSNGNLDIVKLLLAENVDINNYDWNGGTPLLYAAYNNHPKCCVLLLQAGADMTIETDSGQTAMSLSLALGHNGVQQVIERHMLGLLQKF